MGVGICALMSRFDGGDRRPGLAMPRPEIEDEDVGLTSGVRMSAKERKQKKKSGVGCCWAPHARTMAGFGWAGSVGWPSPIFFVLFSFLLLFSENRIQQNF